MKRSGLNAALFGYAALFGSCCLTAGIFLIPSVAEAQATSAGERARGGKQGSWHVVRPGETLHSIAQLYLGSEDRWTHLHELNEWIADPDRIEPGQRLKVLRTPEVPPETARLSMTTRRVEGQMAPLPWSEAEESTLLKADDGVRTYGSSSAELMFDDQTRLVLTENSLVYIGGGGRVGEGEVRREMIEVVRGQADLESRQGSTAIDGIEIVLGTARAKPKPGLDGMLRTRLRMPEDGPAALMVYGGESEVLAGGGSVKVGKGMGTTVAEGKPPAPPEKLLAAPSSLQPALDSVWPVAETRFSWQAVAGSASYTLEVCADPDCASLVARFPGLEAESLTTSSLPVSEHYWRITATSPSGLDGYPSATLRFTTLAVAKDLEPPTIGLEIAGRQVPVGGRLFVGPGFEIRVEVEDRESGVKTWWPVIDGVGGAVEDLDGPWSPGPHTLTVEAEDQAGNLAQSEPIAFVYDPLPPELSWGLLAGLRQGSARGLTLEGEGPLVPTQRWRRPLRPFVWSGPADRWLELGSREWTLSSSGPPRLSLRPVKRRMRLSVGRDRGSESLLVTRKRPLWLRADDAGCGVEALHYRYLEPNPGTVPKADGALPEEGLLIVEARDRLGNLTRVEWPAWRAWFVD